MQAMYDFAEKCIKTAYPKANITKNFSESRGQFLIYFKTEKGEEIELYNKNAKDGGFSEKTAVTALERIKKQAENA